MASLSRQKPVSSTAMMVPEKARLKRAIFTITGFPANVVLKADGLEGNRVLPTCSLRPLLRLNNSVLELVITGVIRPFFRLNCH